MRSMVEGSATLGIDPSVSASRCHLPVPGRITAYECIGRTVVLSAMLCQPRENRAP